MGGKDSYGEIGYGSETSDQLAPYANKGLSDVVAIAAGAITPWY